MKSVQRLYIKECSVSGTIPSELAQIPALEKLELQRNHLSGSIPTELRHLRRLFLHANDLTGTIPSELVEPSLYCPNKITSCPN